MFSFWGRIGQIAITIASAVYNILLMRYGAADIHLIVSAVATAAYLLVVFIIGLPPLILTILEVGCFANSIVSLVFLYKDYLWLAEYYNTYIVRAMFGLNTTMTFTFLLTTISVLYNVTYKMIRYPESEYYNEFFRCKGRRELEWGGLYLIHLKSDLVEVKELA